MLSSDLAGLQRYCLLFIIICVQDNKVKVFLREIYCNQFQRFASKEGASLNFAGFLQGELKIPLAVCKTVSYF